jgi:hypothetical protein
LVHSTLAVPGADTVISNVVPPSPATLPEHSTVVPSSVQVGAPTKWPLRASVRELVGLARQPGVARIELLEDPEILD